jgi:hypothetical protein
MNNAQTVPARLRGSFTILLLIAVLRLLTWLYTQNGLQVPATFYGWQLSTRELDY